MDRSVNTSGAPEALGPYSHAVVSGEFVFTSGQLGVDPTSGNLAVRGIAAETDRALLNIASILHASGSTVDRVVKTTVYLVDLEEFKEFNRVYTEFFGNHRPARATVEVSSLPAGARVEIEAIASVPASTQPEES